MLRPNPLQPPRPFSPPAGSPAVTGCDSSFISAEDYDRTGILAGVDVCESRYWWLPELHSPGAPAVRTIGFQATSRPLTPPAAA